MAMTASRKDYEAVASAIREVVETTAPDGLPRLAVRNTANAVAAAFASTSGYTPNGNRRFDRERFLAACGL